MKIALTEITIDPAINPRKKLDMDYVDELRDHLDEVPAVTAVHNLSTGIKLLADGFHRYEAARLEGRTELAVDLRPGDFDLARDLGVMLNLHHGKKLSMTERHDAIRDFMGRHPTMTNREVAKGLAVDHRTIDRVAKASARGEIPQSLQFSQERDLQESGLPEEDQQALREQAPVKKVKGEEVRAYENRDTLRRKIIALKSDAVPTEYKDRIKRGEAVPILFTETGEPVVARDDVVEQAARAVQEDIGVRFSKSWLAAARLLDLDSLEVIDSLSGDVMLLRSIVRDIPAYIEWLQRLSSLAREKLELRQEINNE